MFLKKLIKNVIIKVPQKLRPHIHHITIEDFNKSMSKINIVTLTIVKNDDQLTKELIDVVKEDIKNWNPNNERYD